MEPLESTSIHLIQKGLTHLLNLFPDRSFSPDPHRGIQPPGRHRVRAHSRFHHPALQGDRRVSDTPLWQYCGDMPIPETLAYKIEPVPQQRARGAIWCGELFVATSWLAVLMGQDVWPERYDPLVDQQDSKSCVETCMQMRAVIRRTARSGATACRLHRSALPRDATGVSVT